MSKIVIKTFNIYKKKFVSFQTFKANKYVIDMVTFTFTKF